MIFCCVAPKHARLVFMTFWQGLGLNILATTTDLFGDGDSNGGGSVIEDKDQVEKYARSAQNLLICLEMLGFSIAHFYCFPVEEWQEGYRPVEDTSKFGDNIALGDFMHDLKMILRYVAGRYFEWLELVCTLSGQISSSQGVLYLFWLRTKGRKRAREEIPELSPILMNQYQPCWKKMRSWAPI